MLKSHDSTITLLSESYFSLTIFDIPMRPVREV